MSLILLRIFLFCLTPFGLFLLLKTIRLVKGIFSGKVLAEIPYTQQEILFDVPRLGVYAIWQKGQLFKKTPVDKFALKLNRLPSGEEINLSISIFSPHLSGFETARIEMMRFYAGAGQYRLRIIEGSNISVFEKLFFKLLPFKSIDYSKYFIQVRESRPIYYLIIAIPLFGISAFCIIGGIVGGFMAQDILKATGI